MDGRMDWRGRWCESPFFPVLFLFRVVSMDGEYSGWMYVVRWALLELAVPPFSKKLFLVHSLRYWVSSRWLLS